MTSWANIAKRNIPALATTAPTATTATTAPTAPTATKSTTNRQQDNNPDSPADTIARIHMNEYERSVKEIITEDESNGIPYFHVVRRPGDKPSRSPFMTDEASVEWEWEDYYKNRTYSIEFLESRVGAWRERNNWYLPPIKTEISEAETKLGFYKSSSSDNPKDAPIVSYVTPFRSFKNLSIDGVEKLMWGMLYSRSEELVKCGTVREFTELFESVVRLEIPFYEKTVGSRLYQNSVQSSTILWLFSQHANIFPGRRRYGTVRWKNSAFSDKNMRDPKYTTNMVFNHVPKGGRDDAGICVVERMKESGDDAKIRWLLTAKQMREMQRVSLSPECNPFAKNDYNDYDSDDYF